MFRVNHVSFQKKREGVELEVDPRELNKMILAFH